MSIVVFLFAAAISAIIKGEIGNSIGNSVSTIFILLFSLAFVSDIGKSKSLSKYKTGILIGYFLRLVILYFDIFCRSIYLLPNSGSDSETFYYNAVWQAMGMQSRRHSIFISLFKNIFTIIGTNRLFGQFIVVLFSIVSLCVIAKAIDNLSVDDNKKIRAVSLLSVLPNLAILSSEFLRESIVAMFISISCYYFVEYCRGRAFISILFTYLAVVLGMLFHSGCAGLLVGYTIVLIVYDRKEGVLRLKLRNIVLATIFGIGSVFLYLRYGDVLFSKFMRVDSLADVANTLEYGGSSYAAYVGNSKSVFNIILYSIPRLVFFLFSPFPWQWRGISDVIAFLFSSLYYMYITYITLRFIRKHGTNNRALVISLAIVIFCIVYVFAWGTVNAGTAARHRDKTAALFAVLYAICCNPARRDARYLDSRLIK